MAPSVSRVLRTRLLGSNAHTLTCACLVYVNEAAGSDTGADGSKSKPYASAAAALAAKGQNAQVFVKKAGEPDEKDKASLDADGYAPISGAGLKKAKKMAETILKKQKKQEEAAAKEKEKSESDGKKLEESKAVVLEEDKTLGEAKRAKIIALGELRDKRVKVCGWVHRLRQQKDLTFIVLRDGTGFLQCVLSGKTAQTYDALTLTLESSVELRGTLKAVPEGKEAPGGHELSVDWWQCVGKAPGGDEAISNLVTEDADPSILADRRHLLIRGQTASAVLKVRSGVLKGFRATFDRLGLTEVTPPCMVQTQVEGGSTLFAFDYYGEKAYLTQSSQLYLETVLPSLGDCFCVQESFRAEKSHTRRHLSEYTHIEGELAFINFEELLEHIEELVSAPSQDSMNSARKCQRG